MLRVVVGVAIALALLAASQPALDSARQTRADRAAARELARLQRAIDSLQTEAAPPQGETREAGARRVVTIDLPTRSVTSARVDYVAIGAVPGESLPEGSGDVLAYRIGGGPPVVRRIDSDLRVERASGSARWLAADDVPLVDRGGGRHRIALSLVEEGDHRVVVVRRLPDATT